MHFQKVIVITKELIIKEKSMSYMGEILFQQQKYDEAKVFFDKVIEIDENNANAYYFRGEIFFQENNKVQARSEWRKTLEIDPSHIRARNRYYTR